MGKGYWKNFSRILIFSCNSCARTQNTCNLEFNLAEKDTMLDGTFVEYIYFVNNFNYSNTCYTQVIDFNRKLRSELPIINDIKYSFIYLNNNSEMRQLLESGDFFALTSAEFNDFILMQSGFSVKSNYQSTVSGDMAKLWR